jgi:hypothetical protein
MEKAMSMISTAWNLWAKRCEFYRCLGDPKKVKSIRNQIARIMNRGNNFRANRSKDYLVEALNFLIGWPHVREKFFIMMKQDPKLLKELRSWGLRKEK